MSPAEQAPDGTGSRDLLAWYGRQKRDLPWRRSRDPFAIWVSEIMLQQTQVATVEPFFMAFMKRFPTVEALAAAPEDDVVAAWSGLGYYRRARLLHSAAAQLVREGRSLPRTAEELRQLPGIGPYTAAAIASIAFGEVVPVLDGNVERVAARLLAISEDPKKAAVRRHLVREMASLLDAEHPGDSNQALMELGATICRPQNPDCPLCPLRGRCQGKDRPQAYPPPRRRRATEKLTLQVAVARRGDEILLFRRAQDAELFAGMWELPTLEITGEPLDREEAGRRLSARYGGRWRLEEASGRARHGITHRSITAWIHAAQVSAGDRIAEGPEAAWVALRNLDSYAISSLVEKALAVAKVR